MEKCFVRKKEAQPTFRSSQPPESSSLSSFPLFLTALLSCPEDQLALPSTKVPSHSNVPVSVVPTFGAIEHHWDVGKNQSPSLIRHTALPRRELGSFQC